LASLSTTLFGQVAESQDHLQAELIRDAKEAMKNTWQKFDNIQAKNLLISHTMRAHRNLGSRASAKAIRRMNRRRLMCK